MSEEVNVLDLLNKFEVKFRETDTHFQMNCFLCSDTSERLGLSKENNHWHCFNCSSGGKKLSSFVFALNNKSTIKTSEKLARDAQEEKCTINPNIHLPFCKNIRRTSKFKTYKYLTQERNITKAAIIHFKLGATSILNGKNCGEHLAIPHIKDGKCVNIKYRSLDPNVEKKFKWRREKGGATVLYNDCAIFNLDYDEIIITESEIDTISVWVLGAENVIGLTAGAGSFKDAWYDRLLRFKKIYLLLDNDTAGMEGAEKLAKRLGMGRCYVMTLPEDVKDPNDFIKKYTLSDFNKLKSDATQYQVHGVNNLSTSIALARKKINSEEVEESGLSFPWPRLQRVTGALKQGHLVVLCAKPKAGKSTFAMNLLDYWAKAYSIASGMYSCEMREERLAEKWIGMNLQGYHSFDAVEPEDFDRLNYLMRRQNKLIFTYYPQMGDLELDKVVEKITEMVQRHNLKVFVFDNLHFLCRGDDEKTLIDKATQAFKILAENLNITLILIAHPRKTNTNKPIRNEDLKGSASIFQDADLIILMHRQANDGDLTEEEEAMGIREGAMSGRTEFLVTGRWVEGGKSWLAMLGRRSLFIDRGGEFVKLMNAKERKRYEAHKTKKRF